MVILNKEITFGIEEYDFPEKLSKKALALINNIDKRSWSNSGIGKQSINTKIRSSNEILLEDYDKILNEKIKQFLSFCVKNYSEKYSTPINSNIPLIILRYKKNGEYKYHVDNGPNFYRTVSMLIYLNPDEYMGGETHFEFLDIKIKPSTPKLVLFPSSFMYRHAALPVQSGIKYVIVGWMNDIMEE